MNVRILDTNTPSKEIHLCSNHGVNLIPNSSEYIFTLPTSIRTPPNQFATLSVINAEIPVSFFNISQNNNIFRFKYESDDEKVIQIDAGNYNIQQMLSALNTKLVAFNFTNPVIINWSSLSNKISFTTTTEFTILPTSTCLELLGFSDKEHKGTSLISDGMVDIRGITSIYVNCDLLDNSYHYNANANRNFLHHTICRIPVNASSYGTITYAPVEKTLCRMSRNVLGGAFKIYITDEQGRTIDFNNMRWTITLKVDYHAIKANQGSIYNDSTSFYSNNRSYSSGGNLRNWMNQFSTF